MRRIQTVWAIAAVGLAITMGTRAVAQEGEVATDPAVEAMIKAGTPGEHHQHLAALEGEWTVKATFWQEPSQQKPEVTEARSHFKMMMGGRYLLQEYEGSFMGQPFHGMGITGYDNLSGSYVATWIDNMSTQIMTEKGKCSDGGKVHRWTGKYIDPVSGEEATNRSEQRWEGDDRVVMTMYGPGPDGAEFKMMEIVYTRK